MSKLFVSLHIFHFVLVPFKITPRTGVIKTTDRLDRETHEEHVFMVYAKDDGTPPYTASSIVTIFLEDVNDNAPIFTNGHSYHGYVIEDDFNPKIGQRIQLVNRYMIRGCPL